ncbi:MAG: regulatory signaling modulator protein AmpE [Pseudomonadota bacterium]|nr:regulatory signaling modulator protein AmpE [Pseudomonadota bacterium]
MSLLALLAAMLAQHAYPVPGRQPLMAFYGRMCLSAAKRLNAGDRNSGILAWLALMGAVLVPVALLAALAAAIHPIVLWVFDVAVLYGTLRFLATTQNLSAIEKALRDGDTTGAASRLAQWQAEPVEGDDAGAVSRLAAEHGLREAHHGTFAPLFWFLVLPGPLGLVLYPLALRAARSWEHLVEAEQRDFGWFAARAFHVIDWIPQRATAFVFAVVGNFEDALFCWRSQASLWMQPEEGIVLASGAGALGVRLGETIPRAGGQVERPALGAGEAAREDALASLEGLLWRALIVWAIVYLLAAALQLA